MPLCSSDWQKLNKLLINICFEEVAVNLPDYIRAISALKSLAF
jgi:hypothetical protein